MNNDFPVQAREHFYGRIAAGSRAILSRGYVNYFPLEAQVKELYSQEQEIRPMSAAIRVDIQEALDRLRVCPVCGAGLNTYVGAELERECDCGVFTVTAVFTDGDIEFRFMMVNPREVAPRAQTNENVQLNGSSQEGA